MKNLFRLSLLLMFSLLVACNSQEKEIEKLKSETIAIHDEVMPRMDDIMKLKRSLKLEKDSASAEESTDIQKMIISLENSDRAMMSWMRNYDPQMKDLSESEKIEYLKTQKASISDVSDKMKESIAKAEAYLDK